jgi:hypothetical protein
MHVERPSILCFCLFLNLSLFASVSYAQRETDTGVATQRVEPTENYIRTRLGADSRLYNGREYIRNGTPAKGFPYFEWDSLKPGSLDYDGISYAIPLEYDLAQDQLVIRSYAGSTLISLVGEKILQFSIGACHFRYFRPGIAHLPDAGFYQELYAASQVTLLARRRKNLEFPSAADQQPQYIQINAFFLLLNGSSHKVTNEKELLDILKDKKEELKKYIRKNHLSFKRHMEGSLIQTIAYYQQIKS